MSATPQPQGLSPRAFAIIFCISLATAIGNTGLISVLPAIGRSIGIPDALVVCVFALSALLWTFSSPHWARASDRRGRKPLMILGLTGFVVSTALGGLVVSAGLHQLAPPLVIFGLFLLSRAVFGVFGSAANPASQAYLAERTPPEKRTQAIASLAGSWGLGTVIGPFLAPLFILPLVGLAGPLYVFALIALGVAVMVWRALPETPMPPEARRPLRPVVGGPRPTPLWRDRRVLPFLLFGLVASTCQSGQQQMLGFLVIDRLGLAPLQAQGFIAVAMMFSAVAGLLAQWGVVRMFAMTPRQLLRWGVAIAAGGALLTGVSQDYWTAVVGCAIASLGFGFVRPGFVAGASIAVESHEQGRVAGAVGAVNGINAVFAPVFMTIYTQAHAAPFVLIAVLMGLLLAYAFRNRALRNASPRPLGAQDSAEAELERMDEGA